MSIYSDVWITREEAEKKVKQRVMRQQERLIDAAIKGMTSSELSWLLNEDGSIYYYHVEGDNISDEEE